MGIIITLLVGAVLLGGIKRIGKVSEKLVPFMALLYIVLGVGVIVLNLENVPGVFQAIFAGAFNPSAFTGGVVGSFFHSMKKGVSRGIFSNEAGLGTGLLIHMETGYSFSQPSHFAVSHSRQFSVGDYTAQDVLNLFVARKLLNLSWSHIP